MSVFTMLESRDQFDWEQALFDPQNGVLYAAGTTVSEGSDQPDLEGVTLHGILGSVAFTLTFFSRSDDHFATGENGALVGGTVESLTLSLDSGGDIFALTGLAVNFADLQYMLDFGVTEGRDGVFLNVFAAPGTHFIGSASGGDSFFGSSGADTFDLTANTSLGYVFNYVWTGTGGDDTIHGSNGEDYVDFGGVATGATTPGLHIDYAAHIVERREDHVVVGHFDAAVDDIAGTSDADIFDGDNSNNNEFGNGGNDTLNGNGGDDLLSGGYGDDQLNGGEGFDSATYGHEQNSPTYGVIVNLGVQTLTQDVSSLPAYVDQVLFATVVNGRTFSLAKHQGVDTYGNIDSYNSIERYVGSQRADVMIGGSDDDHLTGAGGNDLLYGGDGNDDLRGDDENGPAGDDKLYGGNGDDELKGGAGSDTLDGGNGFDRVNYNLETKFTGDLSGGHGIIANLSNSGLSGLATNIFHNADDKITNLATLAAHSVVDATYTTGHADMDTVVSIEDLQGTHYDDYIRGSDATNYRENLNANGGNDTIFGGDGDDNIRGGSGNDSVSGGNGNDYLIGGSGVDTVDGGNGYDELSFRDSDHRGSSTGLSFVFNLAGGGGHIGDGSQTVEDDEYDHDTPLGQLVAQTAFSHIESVDGTNNGDTFTVTSAFTVTADGDGGPSNARLVSVSGNGGADYFDDNVISVDNSDTARGRFRVDYGREEWSRSGYDGHTWGDYGEEGVFVNLSKNSANLTDANGNSHTVAGFHARDTYGDTDSFSHHQTDATITTTDGAADTRDFRLTDAADVLVAGTLSVNVQGNGGDDKLFGGTAGDNLEGGDGNDSINGGGGSDYIRGGAGNDTLNGGGTLTDNTWDVLGYEANPDEHGPSGIDVLWNSGSGNSGTVRDNWGDTDVFSGFDLIRGTDQRDAFIGNSGNNLAEGWSGIDIFDGGAGSDTYTYEDESWHYRDQHSGNNASHGAVVDLEIFKESDGTIDGSGTDLWGYKDLFANVENLVGSELGDNFTGSSVANRLDGRDGNDTLSGDAGNDTLIGGNGNDSLNGGANNDSMIGGSGNDTYVVDTTSDVVDESSGSGTDTVNSSITFSLADTAHAKGSVENLTLTGTGAINATGNTLNNTLIGNGSSNILDGGSGNDTMKGFGGNDTYIVNATGDVVDESPSGSTGTDTVRSSITFSLADTTHAKGIIENLTLTGSNINGTGNSSNNVLTGSTGNNALIGGTGNDTLIGGAGVDTLTGGVGGTNADQFKFLTINDSGISSTTRDIITDFTHLIDKIDLSLIDADTTVALDQAFVLDAKGRSTTAVAKGHIGWYQDGAGHTILRLNNDAGATIESTIQLNGNLTLTQADFIA